MSAAAILVLLLAAIAICPCPGTPSSAVASDAHGCCAGPPAPTLTSGSSCCAPDDADPRLAVRSVAVPLAEAAILEIAAVQLPAPIPLPMAVRPAVRRQAPPILRV